MNLTRLLTSTAVATLGLGLVDTAAAQDTPFPGTPSSKPSLESCEVNPGLDGCDEVLSDSVQPTGAPAGDTTAIVVTGSRIARPNNESPAPITTLDASELTNFGDVNLGDALNDLPSLRSTFSQGNSTRFIGTAGLNLLDLRV